MNNSLTNYRFLSDIMMVTGFTVTMVAITFAYVVPELMGVSLIGQVFAHLLIIVFPAFIKLGYVLRLATEKVISRT